MARQKTEAAGQQLTRRPSRPSVTPSSSRSRASPRRCSPPGGCGTTDRSARHPNGAHPGAVRGPLGSGARHRVLRRLPDVMAMTPRSRIRRILIANRGEIASRVITPPAPSASRPSPFTPIRTPPPRTWARPTGRSAWRAPPAPRPTSMSHASWMRRRRQAPMPFTRATASSPRTPASHAPSPRPG